MRNEHWEKIIKDKIAEAKQRGAKKRGWVVLRKSWLTSSINYRMDLGEMAVFSKLIVMADEFGPVPGLISDNDFRPMPHGYLAHQACCALEVFESTLQKCIADDSIYENSHGIFLTHFDDYQFTEYDRQKKYRQAKRERESDPKEATRQNALSLLNWELKKAGRSFDGAETAGMREEIEKLAEEGLTEREIVEKLVREKL